MKTQAQCLCGAVFALSARNLDISGAEYIGRYRSSDYAERCFCKQCGTHLFVQAGEKYLVNAGLFADNAGFKLTNQIFIDRKAPYYALADDTPKLTESEFFAMVGAAQ